MISYNPLWHLLIDKKLKKVDLVAKAKISTATLNRLIKDEPVSIKTIEKICLALNCNVDNVVKIS